MDLKEFNRIVDDAVANGADRAAAEAYVIDGFKLPGKPGSGSGSSTKKAAVKKKAAK